MRNLLGKGSIGFCLVCLMLILTSSVWAERPIRILLTEPFSGPAKELGERFLYGIQLAVEEINAEGGLLGRKVEVVAEDSQAKPDIAVQKLRNIY